MSKKKLKISQLAQIKTVNSFPDSSQFAAGQALTGPVRRTVHFFQWWLSQKKRPLRAKRRGLTQKETYIAPHKALLKVFA